jgi:hypothetical protein
VLTWAIGVALVFGRPAIAQLPEGYTGKDTGNVETPGSTTFDSAKGTFTVTASGSDVWGAEDGFHYAYTRLQGDGHVTARILSQEGGSTTGWGRNGLMIRESDQANARHLIMCLGSQPETPGGVDPWSSNGQFFSIRRINSGTAEYSFNTTLGDYPNFDQGARHGAIGRRELPIWVRIQRRGNLITSYLSPDGRVWSSQIVPQTLGNVALPESMLVGLAVSGMSQAVATTTADNVTTGNVVLLGDPSNVAAILSQVDNRVVVTWTGTPNAKGYTVYRQAAGEAQFVKAGSTTDVTWSVDGGADGQAFDEALRRDPRYTPAILSVGLGSKRLQLLLRERSQSVLWSRKRPQREKRGAALAERQGRSTGECPGRSGAQGARRRRTSSEPAVTPGGICRLIANLALDAVPRPVRRFAPRG